MTAKMVQTTAAGCARPKCTAVNYPRGVTEVLPMFEFGGKGMLVLLFCSAWCRGETVGAIGAGALSPFELLDEEDADE